MKHKNLAITIGISYLIIFFAAIFANFLVIESLLSNPLETVSQKEIMVRTGVIAFLITAVFDIVVAWGLEKLYANHHLSKMSTYFRIMHGTIMGVGVFALLATLNLSNEVDILSQVELFNNIWLIGLFFFGIHLILLGLIFKGPRWIRVFLTIAGVMYILDTTAHFMMPNYNEFSNLFLLLVAVPSIFGELSLAIYFLVKRNALKTS